jgi:uncharacterized protein (DUF4415 family)
MTGKERNFGSDLAKARARRITQKEYDEAPELTDEQLSNAVISSGIRRGRPPIPNPKQAVKLRLDADVLAGFKETGAGWQTLINDTLRTALKKKARPVKVRKARVARSSLGALKKPANRKRA